MLDSIYPANLAARRDTHRLITRDMLEVEIANAVAALPTADAYLGYVDGHWPTWNALVAKFAGTGAHLLDCAVFAADDATAGDREPYDMSAAQCATWAARQLARGVWRPVQYASISNMPELLAADAAAGISRAEVRLLSAHYGVGKHICTGMDGTQWTDTAPGVGGTLVDESLLEDGFFDGPAPAPPVPNTSISEEHGMIAAGTEAETIISIVGGSAKGISLGCDAARTGNNGPYIRVAARSNGAGTWEVNRVGLPDSGKFSVPFTASDVGLISLVRDSNGAADEVPVDYNLF